MTGMPLQGPRADFFFPFCGGPRRWIGLSPGAFRIVLVFSDLFFGGASAGSTPGFCIVSIERSAFGILFFLLFGDDLSLG